MKNTKNIQFLIIAVLLCAVSFLCFSIFNKDPESDFLRPRINSLSIPFVQNQGQVDSRVLYYADTFAGGINVLEDGLEYSFLRGSEPSSFKEVFVGAKKLEPRGLEKSETKVSYFKGSDSSQWKSGMDSYTTLSLGELWKGISVDLRAYGSNVEKIFTVTPGVDPSAIKLSLIGAKNITIRDSGLLSVKTEKGEVEMTKPIAYQFVGGEKKQIDVSYKLLGGQEYSFAVGEYDKTLPLIIDPLVAGTYVGASNASLYGYSIKLDSSGNVFIFGTANSAAPSSTGAYDTTFGGSTDLFVAKLNSGMTSLSSATVVGGSGNDYAGDFAIDSDDTVVVLGSNGSSTTPFPTTAGAYDETHNSSSLGGYDIVVFRMSNDLSSLNASTFLGGSLNDFVGSGNDTSMTNAIKIDGSGNIYITGYTNSTNFPTTGGAYDTSHNNNEDVFVSKFNSALTSLSASTFIGGTNNDNGRALAFDSSGNVLVTGTTFNTGTGFPTTAGAYDETLNGSTDIFVLKLNNTLTTLSASTVLGHTGVDSPNDIALDSSDNVYITGKTLSASFPTTLGAYDTAISGSQDVFVSKFNSALTSLSASTFIGGTGSDIGNSILVTTSSAVYISGTATASFPTTAGALQSSLSGGTTDAFVSKFSGDLATLSASTFYGGTGVDYGFGILRNSSNIYLLGATWSSLTMPGSPYQSVIAGFQDSFVIKLSDDLTGVSNTAPTATIGTPAQVSASTTISFTAVVSDADNTTTTLQVQYSADGSTWASSTLGSVTGSTTTVSTATGQISNIGTNTGTTTLTIAWLAGTDLADTYDTSVYLRIKPYDGTAYASGFTTSTAFAVDTRSAATPTGLTIYPEGQTLIRLDWTGNNPAYIVNNVTLGTTSSVSTAYQSITSGLSCATRYTFKVLGQSFVGTNSDYTSTVSATTYPCSGGGTGGGGGGSSSAPSVQSVPAVTVVTPIATAPVVSTPTLTQLQSQLAVLMQQLQSMQSLRAPAASYSFTSGFGPGSRGEQVRQLQVYLNTHGFPVSSSGLGSLGNETSFFGPATTKALLLFQASLGLTPTPWVGPATRVHLNK